MRQVAFEVLEDVGDAKLGEWIEDREKAFHIRRRLTAEEQSRVGEAVDCRTGHEGMERFRAIKEVLPEAVYPMVAEELGAAWVEE